MNRSRFWIPILVALFLALPARAAEKVAGGWWAGDIQTAIGPMAVQITLTPEEDGSWSGTIDIPSQGIRGLHLGQIETDGSSVAFKVQGIQGDPHFVGTIADDGQSIHGDYHHGKATVPFHLERRDEPFEDNYALLAPYFAPGVPGEGVEGTWLGIMNTGVAKLRLDLVLTRGDDGSLVGTLASPDQGDTKMPLDGPHFEGNELTFAILSAGSRFEGSLSPDGASMIGRWSQGVGHFTVLFQRQATPPPSGE